MISLNLKKYIWGNIAKSGFSDLICIAKSDDFEDILNEFLKFSKIASKTRLFYFSPTELGSIQSLKQNNFKSKSYTKTYWPLKDYIIFMFGKNAANFKISPKWRGDKKRLNHWRLKILFNGNIFERIDNKLIAQNCSLFFRLLLLFPGILWSTFCVILKRNRRFSVSHGFINPEGTSIFLSHAGSMEKDHYGESPLENSHISVVVRELHYNFKNSRGLNVLILNGNKVNWFQKINKLIKTDLSLMGLFFVHTPWREAHLQFFADINSNSFLAGNNMSTNKTEIFSEHCIQIGALDNELWINKFG